MTRGIIALVGPARDSEKLLVRRLEKEGWQVEMLAQVKTANRWLSRQKPQVVLISGRLSEHDLALVSEMIAGYRWHASVPIIPIGKAELLNVKSIAKIAGETLDLDSVPLREMIRRIGFAIKLTHLVS